MTCFTLNIKTDAQAIRAPRGDGAFITALCEFYPCSKMGSRTRCGATGSGG